MLGRHKDRAPTSGVRRTKLQPPEPLPAGQIIKDIFKGKNSKLQGAD